MAVPAKIPFYSIMLLLSLLSNVFVVYYIAKKIGFKKSEIISLLLYENVGIILGAKLFTFFQNYNQLNGKFDFLRLGLSAYGALIGAIVFLTIYCLQFKKTLKEILYIFMPSTPLMYAIGKIGCFLVGCCHGIKYNGFGSVVYKYSLIAPKNVRLFPVQIVETIFFTLIFIYLISKHAKSRFDMKTLGMGFILSGVAKFSLDFLRESHVGQTLSTNQMVSIVFIILGIFISLKKSSKN